MRSAYLERRDALLRGLDRHCGDLVQVHNSDAGLHVTVLLREGLDDQEVAARLGRRGLAAISALEQLSGAGSETRAPARIWLRPAAATACGNTNPRRHTARAHPLTF